MAIAIARAGCDVAAVYPAKGHPLAKTNAVSRSFVYRPFRPLDSLLSAIAAYQPRMLVPCDDRAVVHLHELFAAAQTMGDVGPSIADLVERSLGAATSFRVVSSRFALWQAARAENIRVPEMNVIQSRADLADWCGRRPAPWILKADGSWGGHGVVIVNTPKEAAHAYESMRRPVTGPAVLKRMLVNRDPFWVGVWRANSNPTINIQDVIQGRPANCVAFCRDGRVLGLIAVEVVSAQSITGPATVVQVIENRQMSLAAESLAARLKLSGFYGFDFMISDRDRQAFLIEMNPRTALPCHLRLGRGQDLIGALASDIGSNVQGIAADFEGSRAFAYFPQAWHTRVPDDVMKRVHHDVPWDEPDLVKELLRIPWPDRSLLARALDRLRNNAFDDRSRQSCVFEEAAAHLRQANQAPRAVARNARGASESERVRGFRSGLRRIVSQPD